ncbi:abortive infection system toxin AbiGii family protein [Metaclostridioides mangenotii]|uniref:Uncharacterized protein n=1 Tax=Metaclostridioides mangenotii TaxID=1540 RepID=A0ABS4EB19_9FIRM|nr:abortive infection system toxin AbiGii family protein [Clostridioides mangenotii]MBP1855137.1 hypothetical protein [Clostridioides mangenotii]
MCARFHDAFKRNSAKIPETIIRQLEKQLLPDEFKYEAYEDGSCMLSTDSLKSLLNKDLFELPEYLVGNSIDKILEYSYNSQEKLQLKENVDINGKLFRTSNMLLTSITEDFQGKKNITFAPPEFKSFNINLESNNIIKTITLKRQPSKDIDIITFKRVDSKDLVIDLNINKENQSGKFYIKINFKDCKSIDQVIDNLEILKTLGNKTLKLNGKLISDILPDFNFKIEVDSLDYILNFYKKLNAITQYISININPKEEVYEEDIYNLEVLNKCIIKKEPFKEYIKIDNLSVTVDEEVDFINLKNNNISFKTIEDTEIEILETKIPLYSILTIHDLTITGETHEKVGDNYVYQLECSNLPDKEMYKSCMYFTNSKSRNEYLNKFDNLIEEFSKAKEIKI